MNIFQSIVTIFYKLIKNYLSIVKKELVVDIKNTQNSIVEKDKEGKCYRKI